MIVAFFHSLILAALTYGLRLRSSLVDHALSGSSNWNPWWYPGTTYLKKASSCDPNRSTPSLLGWQLSLPPDSCWITQTAVSTWSAGK